MPVLQYVESTGRNPFAAWFDGLDAQAAAEVTIAIARLEQGNLSNTKGVGAESLNAGSILDLAIACTSAATEKRSLFFLVAAQRSVRAMTSR